MPSFEHGLLVQIFRSQPELVPQLLASPLGVSLPASSTAVVAESTLDPLASADLHADLVVELRDAAGALTFAIVVEVQLARDPGKQISWPIYLGLLRARTRCPVALLVVAPDPSVASWAAETIHLGPSAWVRPLVLGPSQIPRIADPEEAARLPGLAVLSARVHGRKPHGEELLPALTAAIASVDKASAGVYLSYVYEALDAAARQALKELAMAFDVSQIDPTWRIADTAFGREVMPWVYIAQERRKALAEGQLQARRELLLRLAGHAGISFDDAQRSRIEACTDSETLDRWIDRTFDTRNGGDREDVLT